MARNNMDELDELEEYYEQEETGKRERAALAPSPKRFAPVIAAAVLVVIIILIVIIGKKIEDATPSKDTMSIADYFSNVEPGTYPAFLNMEPAEFCVYEFDGTKYIDLETLENVFDDRFYWESGENVLLYASVEKSDLYNVPSGEKKYYLGKSLNDTGYVVVKQKDGVVYVALEFADEVCGIDYETDTDGVGSVFFWNEWGDEQYVSIAKDTQMRYEASIKAPILAELKAGDEMYFVEKGEGFTTVQDSRGVRGYVQNKFVGQESSKPRYYNAKARALTHNLLRDKVCMVWHQTSVSQANDKVSSILANAKCANVISPTWFHITDNEGNLSDLADKSYVTFCHGQGVQVWGLFSNLENTDIDTEYILTHTSSRQNLVNNILAKAIQYDLDGINLDIESVPAAAGEAFVEMVRELGLKCRANGIILSVDDPVPTSYSAYYDRAEQACFADYIVLMAYDEHWSGSDEGSVASLAFTENAVKDTIAEGVDASQIIQGNPFYIRIWKETPKAEPESDSAEAAADDYVAYDLSSEAVGMSEAESRIAANGVEKEFSDETGQNFASYKYDGCTYKIWFEDETSVTARMEVMKKYSVAGVSFWRAGFEKDGIWDIILKYVQ